MAMDDRKQRILMAIVSLYSSAGEPVGSNLLSQHFDMAVSSATLRNEMAALTRLGLLEQPHTSAGRVPTAKGYRFYVDHVMSAGLRLSDKGKRDIGSLFQGLDYDPDRLAQSTAKAFSDYLGLSVITTTPRADDGCIAHFEAMQVGRYNVAILAVTAAGSVRTRVAKLDAELCEGDTERIAETLNRFLRFVVEADVSPTLIRTMVDSLGPTGARFWPALSGGMAVLSELGKPSVYFEGQQHLLRWPELEPSLRAIMELINDPARSEALVRPRSPHTEVLFGEEIEPTPIPDLCFVTHRYLAGGGLSGAISVAGPARMNFSQIIPKLEYFSELLGRGMSGSSPL